MSKKNPFLGGLGDKMASLGYSSPILGEFAFKKWLILFVDF
jgi:hypothetical protein